MLARKNGNENAIWSWNDSEPNGRLFQCKLEVPEEINTE